MSSAVIVGGGASPRKRRKGQIIFPRISDSLGSAVEHMACTTEKPRRRRQNTRLLSFHELPDYMKENEFIVGHYRSEWTISRAAMSFFSWHNESINVWTHFVGFLMFMALTLLHLREEVPHVTHLLGQLSFSWQIPSANALKNASCNQEELVSGAKLTIGGGELSGDRRRATRWPFFVFLSGAMFCLLTSSVCHLFCCHSRRLNLFLTRLDYAGIAAMIVASFFPPIFYVFQCQTHFQVIYLLAISFLGILTVVSLLSPELAGGQFRRRRALLFVSMGLTGVIPAVHASVVNWDEPRRPVTIAYEAAMAGLYLTGTAFYVSRVPERWRPGAFDLAGHSHQIFHLFVVAGGIAHYAAALVFLEWRDAVVCTAAAAAI